jgi:hypothetical protein
MNFIDRKNLFQGNKERGELNVYFVYGILIAIVIAFLVLILQLK